MAKTHRVNGVAMDVLAKAYASGRKVAYWLSSGDQITGYFIAKNGKVIAVSTRDAGYWGTPASVLYYGMSDLLGNRKEWQVGTVEAMKAYREKMIAEFAE